MDSRSDGDWLPGWLSSSEALGSEALISQSTGWAWTDRRWMMDSERCAELKGAGLGSEVLGWLGYAVRRGAQRCVLGWDRRCWPSKEALARRPLVIKMLAREALARKAQTFVYEQVSEYGRRP